MKWWRRNQISAPNLTPHIHVYDSHYGVESVADFTGDLGGVVMYCSCGCWKVFLS